jgi:hypothetical protein
MRRRLVLFVFSVVAVVGLGFGAAAPASAASTPVKVGTDQCGNTQVWVNGTPLIQYFSCGPAGS